MARPILRRVEGVEVRWLPTVPPGDAILFGVLVGAAGGGLLGFALRLFL